MTTTRREWQINPSNGTLQIAVYVNDIHCGYVDSHLIAEITAKQTAAYIAPRPAPRKAKVRGACKCPLCIKSTPEDGVQYCRAGREYIAWHGGLMQGGGTYPEATQILQAHIYSLLTHPSDLDPEQAADVLAARALADVA